MILSSVIIPIYNGEKVIVRAIESILKSKYFYNCMEIIIVENGSSDRSFEIVKEYEEKYEMIHVFQSEKGVSAARNLGIDMARGKWLFFLDADDYFLHTDFELLMEKLIGIDTDLVVYNFEKGTEIINLYHTETVLKENLLERYKKNAIENPTSYMTVWGKAFRADIVKNNNIRFNENLSVSEDSDFYLRYLLKSNSVSVSPLVLYHYSIDIPSTMRSYSNSKIDGYVLALETTSGILENQPIFIQEAFNIYVLMHFNIAMVREVFHSANPLSYLQKLKYMKTVSQIPVFYRAVENLKLHQVKSLSTLPLLFIKYHLYVLASLIYKIRVKQNEIKEGKIFNKVEE